MRNKYNSHCSRNLTVSNRKEGTDNYLGTMKDKLKEIYRLIFLKKNRQTCLEKYH